MTSDIRIEVVRDRWVVRWPVSDWPDVAAGVIGRAVSGAPIRDDTVPTARLEQVHGATVAAVDRPGLTRAADAVVTMTRGLRLRVQVADCVPVFLASPKGHGLAHAGWRGTAGRIAAETVSGLSRLTGDEAALMRAFIGPSIGPCCYEVGPEVAERFDRGFRTRDGRHLDLWLANRDQLEGAGIPAERIQESRLCTRCHQHLLHSYRGSRGGPGRIEAVLARSGPDDDHRDRVFS